MKTYAITVAWSNSRKSELGQQLVCVKADNLGDARCQALDTVVAVCKTLGVQRTFWIMAEDEIGAPQRNRRAMCCYR